MVFYHQVLASLPAEGQRVAVVIGSFVQLSKVRVAPFEVFPSNIVLEN
jgi:hypothetical protein